MKQDIMPSKRKATELQLIRAFLRFKGIRKPRVVPNERPDAIATFNESGKTRTVGIELTEYHVDAPPGKASPGRTINRMWSSVQASINRLISHRPNLAHTTGVVFLRKGNALTDAVTQALASELVQLASEFPIAPNSEQAITKFSAAHQLLRSYVRKVIFQGTGIAINVNWACGDASSSSIGISENAIAYIVQQKGRKSSQYSWGQVVERWLIISASGTTVFNSAGPHPEFLNWSSTNLKSVCQSAGFDRIFFWDRMYNWYTEVWPGVSIVQKKWR